MAYENDNIEENLPLKNYEEQKGSENNFNLVNDSLINTVVDNVQNISEEKIPEKVENDNFKNPSQNLETSSSESAIQHSSNSCLISIPVQVCVSFLNNILFFMLKY